MACEHLRMLGLGGIYLFFFCLDFGRTVCSFHVAPHRYQSLWLPIVPLLATRYSITTTAVVKMSRVHDVQVP